MSKKTIICIDDDPDVLEVLQDYLIQHFNVLTFNNPLKGLDYIRNGQICDLVILDIFMPSQNGLIVLEAIRKQYSKLPVLICTGGGSTKDKLVATIATEEAIELGAEDAIIKPFKEEELLISIYKILHKKSF